MSNTLSDYHQRIYSYSDKASEVARQLVLAGVAIMWIFKNPENTTPFLPEALHWPLKILVISLSLDLLQYIYGAAMWRIFALVKEKQIKNGLIANENISAPSILPFIVTIIFYLKMLAMIIAYVQLFIFLQDKL